MLGCCGEPLPRLSIITSSSDSGVPEALGSAPGGGSPRKPPLLRPEEVAPAMGDGASALSGVGPDRLVPFRSFWIRDSRLSSSFEATAPPEPPARLTRESWRRPADVPVAPLSLETLESRRLGAATIKSDVSRTPPSALLLAALLTLVSIGIGVLWFTMAGCSDDGGGNSGCSGERCSESRRRLLPDSPFGPGHRWDACGWGCGWGWWCGGRWWCEEGGGPW